MQKPQIKITEHQLGQATATIQDAVQHLQRFLVDPTDPEGLVYSLGQRLEELQGILNEQRKSTTMQNLNNTILDYVREQPDPTLRWQNPVCPECGSADLQDEGTASTLVGWFPARPEDDRDDCPGNPNRTTRPHVCNACGFGFYYCVHSGNIWVMDDVIGERSKILAGIPNGFSVTANYTCATCGGTVTIEHRNLGKPHLGGKAGYHLTCGGCALDVVLSTAAGYKPVVDYKNAFHGSGPVRFSEQPGICVLNSRGISKGKTI